MAMPIDPSTIVAAANGIGQAVNAWTTERANKQQRKWMEGMYDRQRNDAITDWNMQNDYNSPAAQMQRLKAAGLNPNLVYGNGADATMGAPMRSSTAGNYSPAAPQFDLGAPFMAAYDMKMKDAQIDNMQATRAVAEQDVMLKAAQTQSTLQDANTKEFDLKMKNDLKEINKNMAAQSLNKLTADVGNASNQFQKDTATMDDQIKTIKANADAAVSVAKKEFNEAGASKWLEERVVQEIENLKKDGDIKQFQINLNKLGLTPTDEVYLRILGTLFGPDRVKAVYNKFGKFLDKF